MNWGKDKAHQVSLLLAAKHFLAIFLPLVILSWVVIILFHHDERRDVLLNFETRESLQIEHHKKEIEKDFRSLKSDLVFLAGLNDLQKYLNKSNYKTLEDLEKEYFLFSKSKGIYDQVRFLNEKGMEIVRANFNNGKPYLVPKAQLQSKKHRYYFKNTFELGAGELYVSPFDLNIEKGKIEQPVKPVIRIGTPVFNSYGQKKGIVIFNYLGKNLFENLERGVYKTSNMIMLLNSDGYWLKNQRHENEWGFMYQNKRHLTFGNAFPKEWQQISGDKSGQFYTTNGLFTFATVYPLHPDWISRSGSGKGTEVNTSPLKANIYSWKIVSHLPSDLLKAESDKLLLKLFQFYIVFGILLAVGSWFLATAQVNRKLKEETVKSLNANLTKKNKELEQVIYATSHDLRTPLVNIIGFSKELGQSLKDINSIINNEGVSLPVKKKLAPILEKEIPKMFNYIVTSGYQMSAMLSGLLKLSRASRDSTTISPIDMNRLIISIERTFKYEIQQANITLKIDELPSCRGDMIKINQVFSNLLGNAIKYLDPKKAGKIKISGQRENCHAVYQIEDNGVGISSENQNHIFTLFYRVDPKSTVGEGLGLTIISKIVNNHGGKVWVESEPGKGSKFLVSLPA